MLANLAELARAARAERIGLGAFNVIHLEHADLLVRAAERAERPVVLQISENCVKYHGSLEPLLVATLARAKASAASAGFGGAAKPSWRATMAPTDTLSAAPSPVTVCFTSLGL